MEIYLAIIAGLGGMFGWGLADFFAKKTVDKIGDVKTLLWAQFFGIMPLFLYSVISGGPINLSAQIIAFILPLGFLNVGAYLLFYNGLKKGMISLLAPVFAAYGGIAVLVSFFLFGETIKLLWWIGLFFILIGAVLVSFQKSEKISDIKYLTKGIPEVLLAALLFGFFFPFWNWFLEYQQNGWIISIILLRIIAVIVLAVFFQFFNADKTNDSAIQVFKTKEKNVLGWLILIGFFDALAMIFVAWGYRFTGMTSIVAVLSAAFSLPTIILARIFLKEKLYSRQLIGAAVIIAGIIILAL